MSPPSRSEPTEEVISLVAQEMCMPPFLVARRIKDGDRSVLEALGMVLSWEVTGIHFETPLTQGPMTMAERERIFGKPKATTRKKGKKKKGAAAGPLYYKRSY